MCTEKHSCIKIQPLNCAFQFLGLHTYSVKAFCFGHCVCRLLSAICPSVCPTSDLGNYTRNARNFITPIRNRGQRARIWHQTNHICGMWVSICILPLVTSACQQICTSAFYPWPSICIS